jgi:hypothetical protein
MKKLLLFLFIATLTVSCDDNSNDVQWKIINLVVSQNDWVVNTDADGLNKFYSYQFNMPEISSAIFNTGSLSTYVVLDNAQQVLPYVRHYENNAGDWWTRTVDCDYAVNKMNIYVTNSDFADDLPETMNFRVVLMW